MADNSKTGPVDTRRFISLLERELTAVLSRYCGERGDNEGAVETLERLIAERDAALARAEAAEGEGKRPVCTCSDWEPESNRINGPIILAQARNPHLTQTPEFQFKRWAFCPWCGNRSIYAAKFDAARTAEGG